VISATACGEGWEAGTQNFKFNLFDALLRRFEPKIVSSFTVTDLPSHVIEHPECAMS